MLKLDIAGRGFGLTQFGIPDFVDSSREALYPLRSGGGLGSGEKIGKRKSKRNFKKFIKVKVPKKSF